MFMRRISKIAAFSVFIMMIMITTPSSVYGNYSQDFSKPLDDWLFYAEGESDWTQSSWEISNGTLRSGGEKDFGIFEYACTKTEYISGIWDYDYFFGTDQSYRMGFRISKYPTYNETTGIPDFSPSHVQVVQKIGTGNQTESAEYPPKIEIAQFYHEKQSFSGWHIIGLNFTNQVLTETQVRGWHHMSIVKNETYILVYLDGFLVNQGALIQFSSMEYDSICLWTNKGTGVMFDNISIKPLHPKDDDRLRNIIVVSLTSIFGVGVFMGSKNFYQRQQISKAMKLKKLNLDSIKKASYDFELSDRSIFTLTVGANRVDDSYRSKFKEIIPQEILTYRYLMHPIRLTIMKILYSEDRAKAVDIKHILDISWGEYSNHIKSLEQKGYLEIMNEFNDEGNVIQVVYLLEFGRKQYGQLIELLQQFVAKSSPFEYLMYAQANLRDGTLYPDKSGLE